MATPTLDEAAIFDAARRTPDAATREEFLREACGENLGMRARVDALLREHERQFASLESSAVPAPALPATVRIPSEHGRPAMFAKRLRAIVLTVGAAAFAILLGVVAVVWLASPTNDPGPEELDPAKTTSSFESMKTLAKSYSDLGRDEEARKVIEEMLALQKASKGDRHADTIQTMYSLATTDVKLGRYPEALKLHQEALELRREKYGPDDYQTLLSMRGVAVALDKLKRTAEAIPIIDECLKVAAGKKFRSDFFDLADIRLRYFEKKKDVTGCRTAAELFESIPPATAVGYYHATCMRSVTAAVILAADKSPVGEKQVRAEADHAIVWLQKAIDAGFKDVASLKNDHDLAPLRGRPDFEKLIAKLEAAVKK